MLAAVAAVVSVGAFAGFNTSRPTDDASDLLLANAEALAEDYIIEDGIYLVLVVSPNKWYCYENGESSCPRKEE